jgi:phospho-N-acetylmuramoyl-pentapeptide-transferase
MLILLTNWLIQLDIGFSVLNYLTLRSILATLTSLLMAIFIGPKMIIWLQRLQIGQTVRDDGPESHLQKMGTPTMGGVLILAAISVSVLLWADLTNKYVWVTLAVLLGYGVVGFVDDYRKIVRKDAKGLIAREIFLANHYRFSSRCVFVFDYDTSRRDHVGRTIF